MIPLDQMDRGQETGDRGQETGDRRQETGDRRQETGDRRQENCAARFLGGQILFRLPGNFSCLTAQRKTFEPLCLCGESSVISVPPW
jgi:hypothetical protein